MRPNRGIERRFESLIWKFRLITLVPVVMSLLGSVSCFAIGTYAELSVLNRVLHGRFTHTSSTLLIEKSYGNRLLPDRYRPTDFWLWNL
jgi:uncharacterized membrane protein YqhA